jgi:alpha-L-fucosidase
MMKVKTITKLCSGLLMICMIISSFMSIKAQESNNNSNKLEWFEEARFGMFVHWGLYSLLGGSYQGRTMPDTTLANGNSWYAEWIQQRLEIPMDDYKALAPRFNPKDFNADEWIGLAKQAGMKYFVITAKHHDGFALWNSDVSDFDIGATALKDRDILGELVAACRKHGLRYGFYYSHWQDWEHPQGAVPFWHSPRRATDFKVYWTQKCLPQVKELIERYDPDLLWFDTWDNEAKELITAERRDELISLIRSLSKKCLINGRIAMHDPGDDIDFLEMMDNAYPQDMQSKPWQTPATMNHTWAYHGNDFNWKSSGEMLRYLVSNASKGGNYLLNIGPKADGTLPLPGVRRLQEMGAWLLANGEAIYATEVASNLRGTQDVVFTQKKLEGDRQAIYAHIMKDAVDNKLTITLAKNVDTCQLLDTGEILHFSNSGGDIVIELPKRARYDTSIRVIKIITRQQSIY